MTQWKTSFQPQQQKTKKHIRRIKKNAIKQRSSKTGQNKSDLTGLLGWAKGWLYWVQSEFFNRLTFPTRRISLQLLGWKQTNPWMSYRAYRHPLPARGHAMIKPPKNPLLSILLNYTTFSTELFNCIPHCWLIPWRLTRGGVKGVYERVAALRRTPKTNKSKGKTKKNTTDATSSLKEPL